MPKLIFVRIILLLITLPFFTHTASAEDMVRVPAGPGMLERYVKEAKSGDTLLLQKGVYSLKQTLVIDKNLTLTGQKGTVITGGDTLPLLELTADGIVVEGITFRYDGPDRGIEQSLILGKGKHLTIQHNRFEHLLVSGIKLVNSRDSLIGNNEFIGNPDWSKSKRGNAIYLQNASANRIIDNRIDAVQDGCYVFDAHENRFETNHVTRSRYAIHLMYANDTRIRNNLASGNVTGAMIMGAVRGEVTDNRFEDHSSYNGCGILLYDTESFDIHHNTLSQNGMGIYMETTRSTQIRQNELLHNHRAWVIQKGLQDNRIWNNNMIGNVYALSQNTTTDSPIFSHDGQGNYWDTYQGFDLDRDGYGDAPYWQQTALSRYTSRVPALQVFFNSPVMTALDYSRPDQNMVDPHPAMVPVTIRKETAPEQPGARYALFISGMILFVTGFFITKGGIRHA
ncbi:MAG: right-handed parallel beta-helix repeat-containing protein [Bacillaceae bacterium]|nr:right-handed parallel beta-helix repeat-containing protein [Bacillaceae bacterium]